MNDLQEIPAKEITILRKAKRNNFTIISNTILCDTRLTWKAKGILAYLLHLPDDWHVNLKHLIKQAADGRDSLRSGLEELKACGYLTVTWIRDKGKFNSCEWLVYEEPINAPCSENPNTVSPTSKNPPLLNTNNVLRTKDDKDISGSKAALSVPDSAPPEKKIKPPPKKKPDPSLTIEQKQKLITKYGSVKTDKAIDFLKEWKESKAQVDPRALSLHTDYRRITNWVIPHLEKEPTPAKAKQSFYEKIAANFSPGQQIGGYEINYGNDAVSITPLNGQGYITLKYSESGFWEQFTNLCRKKNIPLRNP